MISSQINARNSDEKYSKIWQPIIVQNSTDKKNTILETISLKFVNNLLKHFAVSRRDGYFQQNRASRREAYFQQHA